MAAREASMGQAWRHVLASAHEQFPIPQEVASPNTVEAGTCSSSALCPGGKQDGTGENEPVSGASSH